MKKSVLVRLSCVVHLIAALSIAGLAQAQVTIGFDGSGLASLKFNGSELLASGALRVNRITFKDGAGETYAANLDAAVTVDAAAGEIRNTYSWGTVSALYQIRGNRLDIALTVTNRGSSAIQGVFLEPLELRLPAKPAEYDNVTPIMVYDPGEPGVLALTTATTTVVLGYDDPGKPIVAGFPWANDRPVSTVFPFRINTDREPGYPNSYPTVNRPIAPDSSDQYRFSLRFGGPGSTVDSLASDVRTNFAARFPATLRWTDKRPIGQLVLATSVAGYPTNPRGWLLDRTIDTTTPAGVAAFRNRILAWATESVAILTQLNAQGMITWDIEGEQYPHPTTYLCDPGALPWAAPEMDAIADEYFRTFTNAGLRVGICIRPQTLVFTSEGVSQQESSDPAQVMLDKIAYAKARWGATLFYVDSNGDPNLPLDADIIERVTAAHPDVLIIPEHENTRYYASTAPYRELRQDRVSTPDHVRLVYPTAFGVTYVADGDVSRYFDGLVAAVRGGDALMTRAWFSDPANTEVQRIYALVPAPPAPPVDPGVPSGPPTPPVDPVLASGPPAPPVEASPPAGNGAACETIPTDMFLGCYYKRLDFAELSDTRVDPSIDFDWGDAAPLPGMPVQNYTIRWRGRFMFAGGDYQFAMNLDDGARLYIDDELVWDMWGERPAQRHERTLQVAPGTHAVRLDYVQFSGKAVISLMWSKNE